MKSEVQRGLVLLFVCGFILYSQVSQDVAQIISALRTQNYAEAKQLSDIQLQSFPQDARLWTLNGLALVRLGDSVHALASFKRALRISPNYLAALEGAAEIEYKNGDQSAVPLLQQIVSLHPGDKTSHAMLAGLAFKRGNCATAVEEFSRSEPLIHSQVTALSEYGSCLVKLSRPEQAIPIFKRIAELGSDDERALYNMAVVQSLARRYTDVIQTLSPAEKAQPTDPDALDLLAEAYEANGDTPRAVEALRQAISANPDNPRYYLHFADLCMAHASYKVGIDMLNVGLKRLPESAGLYTARGVLYIQLGQYDKSDSDFSRAENLDSNASMGMAARGMAALQQNNLPEAEATIRDRLSKQPNDAFLQYLLAETLARRGAVAGTPEFAQAIEAARKAIQLQPNLSLARDVLSRLYLQEGNVNGAIEQSRAAVRANPDDQTALYHLILALRKAGKNEEVAELTNQFAALRERVRKKEANERRYTLVEQNAMAQSSGK
jgi:tetratricopeptide (TPR) repeat protein